MQHNVLLVFLIYLIQFNKNLLQNIFYKHKHKTRNPINAKKAIHHGQPIFIVNLKSNTMKNTMQI